MDMSTAMNSTMMSMSSMMMIFYTSTSTPLYSSDWVPSNTGQYAGACIFLIVLATVFRGLFAIKAVQERRWWEAEMKRRYVFVSGKIQLVDSSIKTTVLSEGKSEEDVMVEVKTRTSTLRPWRLSTDIPRAVLDTIIAGVGYLLMLGVMTMNVGYFMSVLGGTFLGSLLVGRYAATPAGAVAA